MDRRLFVVPVLMTALACGSGGSSSDVPATAPAIDRDGGERVPPPELAVPTSTPEPEATPTPSVLVTEWETFIAVYLAPPADGVLRSVAELPCVAEGECRDIVLIACVGTSTRVDTEVRGETRCRTLPASSYPLDEFAVRTEGTYDPATQQMTTKGVTPVSDGFDYAYEITVQLSPDGNSLAGIGSASNGTWPFVLTGRILPDPTAP